MHCLSLRVSPLALVLGSLAFAACASSPQDDEEHDDASTESESESSDDEASEPPGGEEGSLDESSGDDDDEPKIEPPFELVFVSGREEGLQLFGVNADGSGLERLTEGEDRNLFPSFSPDGESLAFSSTRDGGAELYQLDIASRAMLRLTMNEGYEFRPVWSPTGESIAFTMEQDDDWFMYSMSSDGERSQALNPELTSDSSGYFRWSPDGSRLSFEREVEEERALYIVDVEGGEPQRFPVDAGVADHDWAPSGEQLVYVKIDESGQRDLFVAGLDGTNEIRLTDDRNVEVDPRWSPNGLTILFTKNVDGELRLYTVDAEGLGEPEAFSLHTSHKNARWSPSGLRVAFEAVELSYFEIFVWDLVSGNVINVSDSPGSDDISAVWHPLAD